MNLGSKDKKGGGIKKLASSMGKCCLLHDIRLFSPYTHSSLRFCTVNLK